MKKEKRILRIFNAFPWNGMPFFSSSQEALEWCEQLTWRKYAHKYGSLSNNILSDQVLSNTENDFAKKKPSTQLYFRLFVKVFDKRQSLAILPSPVQFDFTASCLCPKRWPTKIGTTWVFRPRLMCSNTLKSRTQVLKERVHSKGDKTAAAWRVQLSLCR